MTDGYDRTRRQIGRRKRLADIAVTLGSSVVANASIVVGTLVLVRHLGAESFGQVALLTAAASALSSVTAAGSALYIVRSLSLTTRTRACREENLHISAAEICTLALVGLIGAAIVGYGLFSGPQLPWQGYACAAAALLFISVDSLAKNRLVGYQLIGALALVTAVGAVVAISAQIVGAFAYGTLGYLAGFAAGSAIQAAMSRGACLYLGSGPPTIAWRRGFAIVASRPFVEFVAPATLSASLVPLSHWLANLVAVSKSDRYADVALLQVGMQWCSMVLFVPTVLNKLVLPQTIRQYAAERSDESRSHVWRSTLLIFAVASPLPALFWLMGEPLMALYGFADGSTSMVVTLFIAAGVLASASIPASNYLVAFGKMKTGLAINTGWMAVYLTLAMLIPGAAAAVGGAIAIGYLFALSAGLATVGFGWGAR